MFFVKSIYWLILILPFLLSINTIKINKNISKFFFFIFTFILILIIGFRNEIGGDWGQQHVNYYINSNTFNLFQLSFSHDYGYTLMSHLFVKLNLPFYILNLFIALVSILIFFRFAKQYKEKWFFIFLSTPTLIIVVFMGFSRQGFAASLLLLAYMYLIKKKNFKFFLYCFLSVLFHKSALFLFLIFLIIKFFQNNKNFFNFIFIGIILFFSFTFLQHYFGNLLTYYVYSDRDTLVSQGAPYRLLFHLLAIAVFIFYGSKFNLSKLENRFYIAYSIITLISVILVFSFSTLVDRILIFFLPFQFAIFANYVQTQIKSHYYLVIKLFFFLIYFFFFFIWVNYSDSAHRWIPYKSIFTSYAGYFLITKEYKEKYNIIENNPQLLKEFSIDIDRREAGKSISNTPLRNTDELIEKFYFKKNLDIEKRKLYGSYEKLNFFQKLLLYKDIKNKSSTMRGLYNEQINVDLYTDGTTIPLRDKK